MVINGTEFQGSDFTDAKLEGDRIRLPAHLADLVGLTGKDRIDCWLLVLKPGRYRLAKRPTGEVSGSLSKILAQIEELGLPGDLLDNTESDEEAGIRARLIPCVATPRGPGWRISVPKVARKLAPDGEEAKFVFILTVAGYVEIWFPNELRQAVSVSISELL